LLALTKPNKSLKRHDKSAHFYSSKKMTNSRGEEKQYQVILYARSHLTQP
jgi:hypothetical protein